MLSITPHPYMPLKLPNPNNLCAVGQMDSDGKIFEETTAFKGHSCPLFLNEKVADGEHNVIRHCFDSSDRNRIVPGKYFCG